ncbi:protein Spindly [Tribolium castaneum]|uniref:protein Spindly n=1 Tax=Tribolium castaneum TaxID=7070 RepID=UPI0030FED3EA
MSSVVFQIVITFFQDLYALFEIKMCEPSVFEDLKTKYQQLQVECEQVNQHLHDYRRQIKIAQTLEAEYQEEIRLLQSQGTLEAQKLKEKVHQLEESIVELKSSHNERIENLEKELAKKEEEIDGLKKELKDVEKLSQSQNPESDSKLLDQISKLEQLNFDLNEKLCELEQSLESSEQKNATLQETVKELEALTAEYKESLDCKRQELAEANILLENLKDENLAIKSQLDMVTSKPLDDKSQGNSLFAEVDDRRVQLQQNMNTMKSQYLEMKRERASYLKQIRALRNENVELMAKMEAEIKGRQEDEEMISETYKNQINALNELIASYQKERESCNLNLKDVPPSASGMMKYFDNMLAMKNKEMEDLRQLLSSASLNTITQRHNLIEAQREIRKNNLEILQLKNEIGQLNMKIEEMQMVSPTEKTPEIKQIEEIKNVNKTNKENEGDKNVQFSEDTLDPKVTDRKKLRKNAKTFVLQSIHYD